MDLFIVSCQKCGFKTNKEMYMKQHTVKTAAKLFCKQCDFKTNKVELLVLHQQFQHGIVDNKDKSSEANEEGNSQTEVSKNTSYTTDTLPDPNYTTSNGSIIETQKPTINSTESQQCVP